MMITPEERYLTFGQQLTLLMMHSAVASRHHRTHTQIAAAVGLSEQTLTNLLNNRSSNPRLNTLRALCSYYQVSLAYFDCKTAEACRAYLRAQRIQDGSPLVVEIENAAQLLSQRGRRNILAALEWMYAASGIALD